jgi:phosphatidylglycerophosphate synthase
MKVSRHAGGGKKIVSIMAISAVPLSRDLLRLPNLLTLSRVPMAGLVWLRPRDPLFVLGLMALAGVTDVLDGWLERRPRQREGAAQGSAESMGAWLDPLCDKVFVFSLVTAITIAHGLPVWMIPLIAARELLQTAVLAGTRAIPALRRHLRPRFRANVLGKAVTVAQFATVTAILLKSPLQVPLAVLTAILGAIAVGVYVLRARG